MDYTDRPDTDVVALALEGRESAYRELIRRYERPVFSLIFRMVRDRALAEDLAQDSFVKMFNALDRYKPEYKFSSWMFKIANNTALDEIRKKGLKTVSLQGAPDAVTPDQQAATTPRVASDDESPEQYVEAQELGAEIERALGLLRPEYRTPIVLYHLEGRPYEEIAEIMELPLGTVKTYIHRGRKELRVALEHMRVA